MTEKLSDLDVLIENDKMFYDKEVVPRQEKLIESVVVGTPDQVLGTELNRKIEDAFADPETDISMSNTLIMSQMQNNEKYYTQGSRSSFTEVDGMLVRRRYIDEKNRIMVTEVLNSQIPQEKANRPMTTLKIEKYLVTDTRTGKATDIMTLKPENTTVYLEVINPDVPMGRGDRSNNQGNESFILDSDIRPDDKGGWFKITKEKMFLHEVPMHGSQDHPKLLGKQLDQNIKMQYKEPFSNEDVADMVSAERNAWQMTGKLLDELKRKGLDLKSADDPNNIYHALKTYDTTLGTGNRFSKPL